jgi:hypothetical protein
MDSRWRRWAGERLRCDETRQGWGRRTGPFRGRESTIAVEECAVIIQLPATRARTSLSAHSLADRIISVEQANTSPPCSLPCAFPASPPPHVARSFRVSPAPPSLLGLPSLRHLLDDGCSNSRGEQLIRVQQALQRPLQAAAAPLDVLAAQPHHRHRPLLPQQPAQVDVVQAAPVQLAPPPQPPRRRSPPKPNRLACKLSWLVCRVRSVGCINSACTRTR